MLIKIKVEASAWSQAIWSWLALIEASNSTAAWRPYNKPQEIGLKQMPKWSLTRSAKAMTNSIRPTCK